MNSPFPLQHRLAGVLLCLLGSFVLTGWAFGNEVMVRVVPGSPAMSINTAAMFLLSGTALLIAGRDKLRPLLLAIGSVLVVLPLAILSQHLFGIDLGIDLASVHAALGDGHSKPGRTAPNACLGFLFGGLVVLFQAQAFGRSLRRAGFILSALTLAIGVMALLGYMLNLEAMYTFASFNRMATLTALGVAVLGAGCWALNGYRDRLVAESPLETARRIARLSAVLLTVFAVTAGLTGFAVLRAGFEQSSEDSLHESAKASAKIISSALDRAVLLSDSIAKDPRLLERVADLQTLPPEPEVLNEVSEALESYSNLGFTGVRLIDTEGQQLISGGDPVTDGSEINLPLHAAHATGLFWRDGFIVRMERELIDDGQLLGRIVLEHRLPAITQFMAESQRASQTSDALLCGQVEVDVVCFPSRFYQAAVRFPMFKADGSPAFPISRALLGESGAESAVDLHGKAVQGGFAPVQGYALGVVVKKEVAELYAPLRKRLNLLIVVLTLFVAVGTLLLRQWVQPLVARIVSEQARMRAILDSSGDAFAAVDPHGLVSDWSLQAERTFGWTAKEAKGLELAQLIFNSTQLQAHGEIAQLLHPGSEPVRARRVELTARHKDGHELPVELSVAPFRSGEGYGASVFLRDLTARKQSEQLAEERARELEAARAALVQSQKLEAVGKLTGGVAHDFNNVLQVVRGSLQLLQLECAATHQTDKRFATAMSAVDRGAKLSAQLLAFARKQPLEPKVVNLSGVVRGMGEILQRALGDAIDIEIIVAGGLWNTLVDPHQLENVILNLAINARDAMSGEGKLTIEVGNSTLDEEYVRSESGLKAGQFVMVAISDTGVGMSQEVLERAFEPFFTTKPEGEGTGLGLSMAHGFVKQSEGHIRIYSELGHGTTIRIYLPRCFEQEDKAPVYLPTTATGGDETILVVEDDLSVQATVVDLLRNLGYRVLKADNAQMALEVIEKEPAIDLLFTDVVMPGPLRSPELARKAQARLPGLQVLFTSGYTQNAIVHGGRLDPGVHLLSKPYGRDQLARKIRELLNQRSPRNVAQAPLTRASESSPHPTGGWEAAAKGLQVVFVEDNDSFRAIVVEMLEMWGHRVESFASSEAAMGRIISGHFDVLLSDVSLPGISGVELASIARGAHPELRIILASGYDDAGLDEELDFQFTLLPKPFSMEQLQACLAEQDLEMVV